MKMHRLLKIFLVLTIVLPFFVDSASAVESVCAKVKIEIRQEMSFERQGFDAHMQINNGLTTTSLENVMVDVLFSDEDGNPVIASSDPDATDALFYIRINSIEGVSDVTGSGSIPASTIADIHWLIIPAPASVENAPTGKMYYVGARLVYTMGGEEHETVVTPDFIYVKPLPKLSLDYFLPDEVYGDDPFTTETEPSIPFSLGVRIANNGDGVAGDLKIDSAQPKIVENEQGLLVDFLIVGTEVDGVVTQDSLLLEFGDLEARSATLGRWLMTCSLSGRFVEFDVAYSHANELGGELTSLIDSAETHFLVQDVLVDAPGRDDVRDFLGRDGDFYKVYESDAGVSEVVNMSAGVVLSLAQNLGDTVKYDLQISPSAGFVYLKFDDPQGGNKVLTEVLRSDGKIIKAQNGWLSKIRVDDQWSYYSNIFDYNTPGSYTLIFVDPSIAPQAPEFAEQEDPVIKEGEEVSFIIEATDPNDAPVMGLRMLSMAAFTASPQTTRVSDSNLHIDVGRLPVGVRVIDLGGGRLQIIWTPETGQAGKYPLVFTVTDGEFVTVVRYTLTVTDPNNTPTADFNADPLEGAPHLLVSFADQSTSQDGLKSWLWDFGDGTTSIDEFPFHTYTEEGQFTVSLTVTEIDGDSHTKTVENYVKVEDPNTTPVAAFIADPMEGETPLPVTFTDQTLSEEGVIAWNWDFGDGTSSNEQSPTHTYETEGSYTVSLTVTEADGDQNVRTIDDCIVAVSPLPPMEFARIQVDHNWQNVEFQKDFLDPVVVATISEATKSEPAAAVRIRNITATGFEICMQESSFSDGVRDSEELSYLVMESGSYTLVNGVEIIAGHTESDSQDKFVTYSFPQSFATTPVVLVALTSDQELDPSVITLERVSSEGFSFVLQGERRNNLIHGTERVDFIAWEQMRGLYNDILIAVNFLEDVDHQYYEYNFGEPFNFSPVFLATSQTHHNKWPGVIQCRNVSPESLEIRIAQEASSSQPSGLWGNPHGFRDGFLPRRPRKVRPERVGFIALSEVSDEMDSDGDGLTDQDEYLIYHTLANQPDSDDDGINDQQELEFWGELWDNDFDNDGLINLLDSDADNDGYTDGFEIFHSFDPADSESRPYEPIMEFGRISVDHNWQNVQFGKSYIDPIVVATISGAEKQDPAVILIRDIGTNNFEIRLQEGVRADGYHSAEEISYIVIERARYTLANGTVIVADRTEYSANRKFVYQKFTENFPSTPIVMANAVISDQVNDFTVVTLRSIGTEGFAFRILNEQKKRKAYYSGRVDFVAWEASVGTFGNTAFEVGLKKKVNHHWKGYDFSSYFSHIPALVATSQSSVGSKPSTVSCRYLDELGFEVQIAGKKRGGNRKETVGFISVGKIDE